MNRVHDRAGGLVMFAFSLTYLVIALDIPVLAAQQHNAFTARTLPLFLAVCGLGLSMLLICFPQVNPPAQAARLHWGRAAGLVVLMSLYGRVIRDAGFLPATTVFLTAGFMLLGARPIPAVTVAATVAAVFWWLMAQILGVYLPAWPVNGAQA